MGPRSLELLLGGCQGNQDRMSARPFCPRELCDSRQSMGKAQINHEKEKEEMKKGPRGMAAIRRAHAQLSEHTNGPTNRPLPKRRPFLSTHVIAAWTRERERFAGRPPIVPPPASVCPPHFYLRSFI